MNRHERAAMAADTLRILDTGTYTLPDGGTVAIGDAVARCRAGTTLHEPDALHAMVAAARRAPATAAEARIDVRNETTLAGAADLLDRGAPRVVALNFASAKNPGGGFLGGSEAQEESLARSSALYGSLLCAPSYHERHRHTGSALYTDTMVLSPDCPVFRDDDGALLARPRTVSFITSAAPNAGAVATNQPGETHRVLPALARRAECVLALAVGHGYRHLVLGAWGCGVFRNDPADVASVFHRLLREEGWARHFEHVRFSVLDRAGAVYGAFESRFG